MHQRDSLMHNANDDISVFTERNTMNTPTPSRPFSTLRSKAGRFIVIGVALSSAALLSMTGMSYAEDNARRPHDGDARYARHAWRS
jgi:hypothetical protein